jgi:hypothetical protein
VYGNTLALIAVEQEILLVGYVAGVGKNKGKGAVGFNRYAEGAGVIGNDTMLLSEHQHRHAR